MKRHSEKGITYRECKVCGSVLSFKILNLYSIEHKTYCKKCRKYKTQNETNPYNNDTY